MRTESEIAESRIKGMNGIPDGTAENLWALQVRENDRRLSQSLIDQREQASKDAAARAAARPPLSGNTRAPSLGAFVGNGGFFGAALAVLVLFIEPPGGAIAQAAAYLFSGYLIGAAGGLACYAAYLLLRVAVDLLRVLVKAAAWLFLIWVVLVVLNMA